VQKRPKSSQRSRGEGKLRGGGRKKKSGRFSNEGVYISQKQATKVVGEGEEKRDGPEEERDSIMRGVSKNKNNKPLKKEKRHNKNNLRR